MNSRIIWSWIIARTIVIIREFLTFFFCQRSEMSRGEFGLMFDIGRILSCSISGR